MTIDYTRTIAHVSKTLENNPDTRHISAYSCFDGTPGAYLDAVAWWNASEAERIAMLKALGIPPLPAPAPHNDLITELLGLVREFEGRYDAGIAEADEAAAEARQLFVDNQPQRAEQARRKAARATGRAGAYAAAAGEISRLLRRYGR